VARMTKSVFNAASIMFWIISDMLSRGVRPLLLWEGGASTAGQLKSANGMDRLLPESQQVSLLRLYLLTIGAASHGKQHKN